MYENENIKIIKYLILLELDSNTFITEEMINKQYHKLAKIYHPDLADEKFKNGEKFIQLQEAKDYLLKNIYKVNNILNNNFSENSFEEDIRENTEEQNVIEEKIYIMFELKKILEYVSSIKYSKHEYKNIVKLINNYLEKLPTSTNYKEEYEELIDEIVKVSKKKKIKIIIINIVKCLVSLIGIFFFPFVLAFGIVFKVINNIINKITNKDN